MYAKWTDLADMHTLSTSLSMSILPHATPRGLLLYYLTAHKKKSILDSHKLKTWASNNLKRLGLKHEITKNLRK